MKINFNFLGIAILFLISLTFLIKAYNEYLSRVELIEENKIIQNFIVLEKFCFNGIRTKSYIDIKYLNKEYKNIPITQYECKSIEQGANLKLFYDKDSDSVFSSSSLTKRMLIGFSVITLFFFIWLLISIRRK